MDNETNDLGRAPTGQATHEPSPAVSALPGECPSRGWSEWSGGDLPVARDALVSVKMRAYAGTVERRADELRWWHGPAGDPHDIIAYRPMLP